MNKSMKSLLAFSTMTFALVGTAVSVLAAEPAMPNQPMMQGQAKGGGAPCAGYGPGMGMMGGYGPGMMGAGMGAGYGMGHGMMGGWAGGMGPMAMLDLSDAQTAQVEKVQTEMMKKQRTLMRQMWEEQGKLGDLMKAEKRDLTAIGKAYVRFADVQRQVLDGHIDAENKMAAVLTKEQKAQMHRGFGRGKMGY